MAMISETEGGVFVADSLDEVVNEEIDRREFLARGSRAAGGVAAALLFGGVLAGDAYGKRPSKEERRLKEIIEANLNDYNAALESIGLKQVERDRDMDKGAMNHARYLVNTYKISDMSTDKFRPHEEDPDSPFHTVEGEKAAKESVIAFGWQGISPDAKQAASALLSTLYHRHYMTNADKLPSKDEDRTEKIGIGYVEGKRYWAVVIHLPPYHIRKDGQNIEPIIFPPDGSQNVGTKMYHENPSAIKRINMMAIWGTAFTATFYDIPYDWIKNVDVSIRERKPRGKVIDDVYMSHDEKLLADGTIDKKNGVEI